MRATSLGMCCNIPFMMGGNIKHGPSVRLGSSHRSCALAWRLLWRLSFSTVVTVLVFVHGEAPLASSLGSASCVIRNPDESQSTSCNVYPWCVYKLRRSWRILSSPELTCFLQFKFYSLFSYLSPTPPSVLLETYPSPALKSLLMVSPDRKDILLAVPVID